MTNFKTYLADNPITVPETASGHYLAVAELLRFWEWSAKVQDALVAGEQVPHDVVEEYLVEKCRNALPPSRRKDYPDLAERFPICYELQPDGSRKLV